MTISYTPTSSPIRDIAGNNGASITALSIVNNTIPPPGTIDLDTSSDTGFSRTDKITSDTTPDIILTCVNAMTVTLYDNETVLGTGVCQSNTVTITSSLLTVGTHILHATQGNRV